jgi:1-acyl-sn-glycerol-3-phosphate acyltransferase
VDDARVIPFRGSSESVRRLARRASNRRAVVDGDASVHQLDAAVEAAEDVAEIDPVPPLADPAGWEQRLATALRFLGRRMSGDYQIDEFGFDAELTRSVIGPLLAPLYDRWFRVEVSGVEHLPAHGGALLVANHAGGLWPLDAAMTATAVHRHSDGRFLRMLGAELLFAAPGVSTVARRSGATLACEADVARLLAAGELVGVWPEGYRGIGKSFRRRYELQRFSHGGFVGAAVAEGVPVIPVSIVGSEEIHPVLANLKPLARLLNLPYFPITPTFPLLGPLGLVPLPSKWQIAFGAPLRVEPRIGHPSDQRDAVGELTDEVRERIQSTLYRLLTQRRAVWR